MYEYEQEFSYQLIPHFVEKTIFQFNMILIPELRIKQISSIFVYLFGVPLWRQAELTHPVHTQNLSNFSW